MICSERTTRVLPGLTQALDWLRQNLPQPDHGPALIPVPVRARPKPRRPHAPDSDRRRPLRHRFD